MKRPLKKNTKTHLFIYLFYIDLNNVLNNVIKCKLKTYYDQTMVFRIKN